MLPCARSPASPARRPSQPTAGPVPPWLSWVPFAFLARLPALDLKPLPLTFGRRRCRTGLVARRAAEDLEPLRRFEDIVRDIALERTG